MRTVRTALCMSVLFAAAPAGAQDSPYHEDGWAKFSDGRKWGWASAIDIDKRGNIWVFERCGANSCAGSKVAPVVQLTPQGKVLQTFGAGMFAWPHGIHIDKFGNIWVTDGDGKEGKGHKVVKFSPTGKVLMTLGKEGLAGDGPDTFNRPSDVLTAPNGDIFVADGHGGDSNARIVKLSPKGKFIKAWGRKGGAHGEFDTPHALAMDSQGRLFVGDRGNNRIQIFDQDGNFLEEWKQFGRPSGLYIDRADTLYVADHQSDKKLNPGVKRGIHIGSARTGKVASLIPGLGADPETQSVGEGVVADPAGTVWWAETSGMAVRKFVLR